MKRFFLTAASAASQRAGGEHLLRLLLCGWSCHAHFFLLLYASVRITCINIRNGAKMELNNLSATIYADTYRSQRETNLKSIYAPSTPAGTTQKCWSHSCPAALPKRSPLSTDDYTVSDISLEFNVVGDRVEYIFYCDVDFYVRMFGHSYPTITQR